MHLYTGYSFRDQYGRAGIYDRSIGRKKKILRSTQLVTTLPNPPDDMVIGIPPLHLIDPIPPPSLSVSLSLQLPIWRSLSLFLSEKERIMEREGLGEREAEKREKYSMSEEKGKREKSNLAVYTHRTKCGINRSASDIPSSSSHHRIGLPEEMEGVVCG